MGNNMDKNSNKYFEWIDFYMKLADIILGYKEKRKELISILESIFEVIKKEGDLYDKEQECLREISPFTIFGFLNRGSNQERYRWLKQLKEKLDIKVPIPTSLFGVPILSPMECLEQYFIKDEVTTKNISEELEYSEELDFFEQENKNIEQNKKDHIRDSKDGYLVTDSLKEKEQHNTIENLWNLFEAAIKYADGDGAKRKEFVMYYNKVIEHKLEKWVLTKGLYWIRPQFYIHFDGRVQRYCRKYNLEFAFEHRIMKWDFILEAEEYLQTAEVCKMIFMEQKENKIRSFPELSLAAWKEENDNSYEPLLEEYDTGICKDDWIRFMEDEKIISYSAKVVLYQILRQGGICSCSKLSEIYHNSPYYYNVICINAAKNIYKKTSCMLYEKEGKTRYWPILFQGKYKKENGKKRYLWKLREELQEALEEGKCLDIELDYDNLEKQEEENGFLKEMEPYSKAAFLREVYLTEKEYITLTNLIFRKKNIILQGAPGVGKTFIAKRLVYSIIGHIDSDRVAFVQFHQSYSYEDFIMGYRPYEDGFQLEYGVFYNFCKKAEENPEKSYFFLIDEINRGNLSKIFGELLMLMEYDKRGQNIILAYQGMQFCVPENVYIIGMMNTADRSIAMMDYALRRRFCFFRLQPAFDKQGFLEYQEMLHSTKLNRLIQFVKKLNQDIINDSSLGEGFLIGHSYFCGQSICTNDWLEEIIEYELIPIIEEYWFDDSAKINVWKKQLRGVLNE